MPAYDENPSVEAVLKRARERVSTITLALNALGSSTRIPEPNERSRQASKNLEMLVDRKEMRQVSQLSTNGPEINEKLSELRSVCERFVLRQTIEPDRRERLDRAIGNYVSSAVGAGNFVPNGGTTVSGAQHSPGIASRVDRGHDTAPREVVNVAATPAVGVAPPTSDGAANLASVLRDEARCKAAHTCPRLTTPPNGVSSRFHEPNARTIKTWQDSDGAFKHGIDRRVVFVCESPSKTNDPPVPDFEIEGVAGYRCWSGYNARSTDPFTEFRRINGFDNCLITNVVKCGVQSGKPTAEEIRACSLFLYRELSSIGPDVIAVLGRPTIKMIKTSRRYWPGVLASAPAVLYMTHYSATRYRMTEPELWERWTAEAAAIKQALVQRGVSESDPRVIPLSVLGLSS